MFGNIYLKKKKRQKLLNVNDYVRLFSWTSDLPSPQLQKWLKDLGFVLPHCVPAAQPWLNSASRKEQYSQTWMAFEGF